MIRHFWDAATALDPAVAGQAEARRFPLCRSGPLRELWTGAGLTGVGLESIEVRTRFEDFDDFWAPFLGGQGPAPRVRGNPRRRAPAALRDLLRERLPVAPDGSIVLSAGAWAVRGNR